MANYKVSLIDKEMIKVHITAIDLNKTFNISGASDVNFSSLTDDDILQYNSSLNKWENKQVSFPIPDGSITEPKLDFVNSAIDGYIISWDATSGKFKWSTSMSATDHAGLAHLDYASAGHTGFEPSLSKGNLTETISSVLTITGGTGAIIGSGLSIRVKQASSILAGYLSSTDWNTFNNKESVLTFSDGLTRTLNNIVNSDKGSTAVSSHQSTYNHLNYNTAYSHSQVVTGNPHGTTKSDLGLGNVENTALSTWIGSSYLYTVKLNGTTLTSTVDGLKVSDSTFAAYNHNHSGVYQPVDTDLTAIAGLSTLGLINRTAEGTMTTITDNHSNWDSAYGWGNHAGAGYFIKASDTLDNISTGSTNVHLTTALKSAYDAAVSASHASGSDNQNLFATITPTSGESVVADSTADTLILTAGSGISITGVASTDTITVANTDTGSGAVSSHNSTYDHTKLHSQNTDTGTDSSTFQLDNDSSGVKLKNNAGVLESRVAADNAYADFKADNIVGTTVGDGTNSTTITKIVSQGLCFVVDGGGSALTTGSKITVEVPFDCTITGWTLIADVSGAIQIDVRNCTYANYDAGATHPAAGDSIAGSEKPLIAASGVKNQDLSLTTWTTAITGGTLLNINIESVTTITHFDLVLHIKKS